MSTSTTRAEVGAGEARFDPHGTEPISPADRDSTPMHQFWVWMGANLAPINWVLGALGIALGLSFRDTVVVVVVGNVVGCALFGLFNTMGHRTGVTQLIQGRSAFGLRGAVIPAIGLIIMTVSFVGVNTYVVLDLVLAVLAHVGLHGGDALRYTVAFLIMAVQVGIGIWGFYAIRSFEKYTVPFTAALMVVMTVLAFSRSHIAWSVSTVHGSARVTAITQLMAAIGVGWAITWLPLSSDYARFVRTSHSARSVFWSTALGMFIPTVWLAVLGAGIASSGTKADPAEFVTSAFGVMALPALLVIVHGPLATNILNVYSSSLAVLSTGLRIPRWKVSIAAGVTASAVLVAFLQATSFATTFQNFILSFVVWISPWAGITLVNYFVVRKRRVDVPELYADPATSRYGAWSAPGLVALALGTVAAWSWQFGLVSFMQGPIARATGDSDFSWLLGFLVGGAVYYALTRTAERRMPVTARPAPEAQDV